MRSSLEYQLAGLDPELKVVAACTTIFFLLIGIYLGFNYAFDTNAEKKYSLTFGGSSTFSDDKIALVVGNNNSSSSKSVSLYGISNESETRIFPSTFLSGAKGGKMIDSNRIRINEAPDEAPNELRFVGGGNYPVQFSFSIDNIDIGLYQGWLFIENSDNTTQVPITVSTEAKLVQALILATAGVIAATGFWEFLKWSDKKRLQEEENDLRTQVTGLAAGNPIAASSSLALSRVQEKRVALEKRYADPNTKAKIAVIELGSIFLGIVVSLIGLLSNSFVIGIIDIDLQTAAVLLGIGLGIGSLRLFADKQ